MDKTVFSILLVVIGLVVGFCISLVINFLKESNASKKAEKLIKLNRIFTIYNIRYKIYINIISHYLINSTYLPFMKPTLPFSHTENQLFKQ